MKLFREQINKNEIHVYCLNMSDLNSEKFYSLNEEELIKANKYKREPDRIIFKSSREWLRRIAGSYLDLNPTEIDLVYTSKGKPYIKSNQNSMGLQFNLSHSGEYVLYSFCINDLTGIDIEKADRIFNFTDVGQHVFCSQEITFLKKATNPVHAAEIFYTLWTRKESLIKAEGSGLSAKLRQLNVLKDTVEVGGIDWNIINLKIDNKYKAAVSSSGEQKKLLLKNLKIAY